MAPPADLSPDSRELFDRLASDFEAAHRTPLAEVDAEVLAEGLRARDRAAQVRELLHREGLTVAGSKGQPRQHPLLGEETKLRAQYPVLAGGRSLGGVGALAATTFDARQDNHEIYVTFFKEALRGSPADGLAAQDPQPSRRFTSQKAEAQMTQEGDHLRESGGGKKPTPHQRSTLRPSSVVGLVLGIPVLLVMALSLALAMATVKPIAASAHSVGQPVVADEAIDGPATAPDPIPAATGATEVLEAAPVEPATAPVAPVATEEPAAVTEDPAPATEEVGPVPESPAALDASDKPSEPSGDQRSAVKEPTLRAATQLARGIPGDAVDQCNNTGSVGGDTITCTVTITNNCSYNAATPNQPTCETTVVTEISCTGSAICPTGGTQILTEPVTVITQCNNAGSGGASTITCTVTVTNNLTGFPVGAVIDSTVRQCENTGAVGTRTCVATPPGNNRAGDGGPGGQSVTQCNSSGGTGTLTCTVTAPTSESTGLPTEIRQCNQSGTTGASTVTCTATITNNFIDSIPDDGNGGPGPGGPGSDTPPGGGGDGGPGPGGPGSDTPPGGSADNPPVGALPLTGFGIGIATLFGLFTLLLGVGLRRIVIRQQV